MIASSQCLLAVDLGGFPRTSQWYFDRWTTATPFTSGSAVYCIDQPLGEVHGDLDGLTNQDVINASFSPMSPLFGTLKNNFNFGWGNSQLSTENSISK
jgi:hypothetical protein